MTTTTARSQSTITTAPTSAGRSIWPTAAIAGVIAAVATTAIGAVAKAADVPLVAGDMEIQIPMFAVFTLIGAALGAVIATQLQKRNGQPRRAFVITTVVLTALSFLPDITADATTATKLTLIGAHLVAAAVIIPALAARLTASRAA
ncbi:MAG TPA: DUF6069 family protein [Acidimicrobiia bacterium]|nr:DUF6069 family protein [Acidimicrobiia bacterium]